MQVWEKPDGGAMKWVVRTQMHSILRSHAVASNYRNPNPLATIPLSISVVPPLRVKDGECASVAA